MRGILFILVAAGSAAASASPASASGVTGTMPVTAITVNACAVAASPLVFGTLNQIGGSANDGQTTVVVTCTPGTTYDVGLDNGAYASGGTRHMRAAIGGDQIPYQLFSNASRTAAWGSTSGANTVTGTAGALPATLTVYGRVPAGAPLSTAGAYADVVTVTVTF